MPDAHLAICSPCYEKEMIFYTLIRFWKLLISLVRYLVWIPPYSATNAEICEGKIDEIIEEGKIWRVRYLATYWFARSGKEIDIDVGDYIKVVGRKGLVLWIEPLDKK